MTTKADKNKLILAVQQLLQQGEASSQEELRQALKQQGIEVNQVRISRVLHKLGAIKVLEGNKAVYQLPIESAAVKSSDLIEQMILTVSCNETAVVINTSPGSAQLVARILDKQPELGILGTVAGDDTILVIPTSIKHTQQLKHKIFKLLFSGG